MSSLLLTGAYNGAKIRPGQFLAPPMGIHRIASYLRVFGHDVQVHDTNLMGVQALYDIVRSQRFDFIGASPLDDTWQNDKTVIRRLKAIAPDSIFLAGGQSASFMPEVVFRDSPVDIIVRGWGEFALQKMLDMYDPAVPLLDQFGGIAGLYIKTPDVQTQVCDPYTQDEFSEISSTFDFAAVPYGKYWAFMRDVYDDDQLYIMRNRSMVKTIRLITTSHCNAGCRFCSSTNFLDNATGQHQRVLRLPVDDIMALMKKAIEAHPQVEAFYFNDDNFMTSKRRIYKLMRLIEREFTHKRLHFFALSRVDNVDRAILKRMKSVGFDLIIYGVESFSEKILSDMNKRTSGLKCRQAIEWTLEAGIVPFINLIIFYPTATLGDIITTIETTVDFMKRGARIGVNPFVVPLAGAAITQVYDHDDAIVLPMDAGILDLARRSMSMKGLIVSEIEERYLLDDEITLPVDALALFLAIYRNLGKPTGHIESLIGELCKRRELAS